MINQKKRDKESSKTILIFLIFISFNIISIFSHRVCALSNDDRVLGIDMTLAKNMDYDDAINMALKAGLEDVGLFCQWDNIESAPGDYKGGLIKPENNLAIADYYYPLKNLSLTLTLTPIHTNQLAVPEDLKSEPLNSSQIISRFKDLCDFVFSQLPNVEISYLNLCSEFDIYFGTDVIKWEEFIDFYREITSYIKSIKPDLKLAIEPTFNVFNSPMNSYMTELNQYSDVIGVSYYPWDDQKVKEPTIVHSDFEFITSLYPDKPICFFQYGYPSSPELNSSEEKQSQFIEETFSAWNKYNSSIELIDFTWLHDISPDEINYYSDYYGINDPKFLAFLGSLGLRTYDGKDKLAWKTLNNLVNNTDFVYDPGDGNENGNKENNLMGDIIGWSIVIIGGLLVLFLIVKVILRKKS